MLRNIGTTELIIIAVIVLVLFGGKKLPELGRGIGQAIKEFKKSAKNKD
jgi:sec-independent protein translocase protein TatA